MNAQEAVKFLAATPEIAAFACREAHNAGVRSLGWSILNEMKEAGDPFAEDLIREIDSPVPGSRLIELRMQCSSARLIPFAAHRPLDQRALPISKELKSGLRPRQFLAWSLAGVRWKRFRIQGQLVRNLIRS